MRSNRCKVKRLAAMLLAILLLVMAASSCTNYSSPYRVAIIAKSTTSSFWNSVMGGSEIAANEYGVEITFDGPENEEDYETQNEMLEKAINDRVDAIVFSAIDYNRSVKLVEQAFDLGIAVIIIDSDVNTNKVTMRIGTDNYNAGIQAFEAARELAVGNAVVGIVNFDENSFNGQERERGFRDAVSQSENFSIIDTINVASDVDTVSRETKKLLARHPDMNMIVTFNEWTTLGVGYAIRELGLENSITVIAFDNNITSIGMLETGEIDALVVQNPFAIGYLGVEGAYNILSGKTGVEAVINTETTIATKENMYDSDIQKLIFPFDK